jgi:hypothetical protein
MWIRKFITGVARNVRDSIPYGGVCRRRFCGQISVCDNWTEPTFEDYYLMECYGFQSGTS